MFALIYDTHDLDKPFKEVLSVHKSRETAERALRKRMAKLEKSVEDCNARIVWLKERAKPGYGITEKAFLTWGPGETIPYGELHPDCD
jgi:hypothetical protein